MKAFAARGKRLFCCPTPSEWQYRYDYNDGNLCKVVDCVNSRQYCYDYNDGYLCKVVDCVNSMLIWWSN